MDSGFAHGNAVAETLTYQDQAFPFLEVIDTFDSCANRSFPSHWHPELELHLILRGSVEYIVNGTSYIVRQNQGIYIAPEAIHSLQGLEKETVGYNALFLPQILMNLMRTSHYEKFIAPITNRFPDAFFLDPTQKESHTVLELLRQIYSMDSSHPTFELFVLEKFIGIWRSLLSVFPRSEDSVADQNKFLREARIKTILDFIQQNYTRDITVQDMADAASVSKSECFRCFALLSKLPPIEYLNQYRLIRAAQDLATTAKSISDICYDTGFNSTSYFSKRFKEQYGMSPKAYRTQFSRSGGQNLDGL